MKLVLTQKSAKCKKKIATVLLVILISEIMLPLRAVALTSGPSQPEFQGFSPLATTSLVDPFSGDFSYNIPLLDIDGYPLNLVYRATSNMEEEGSWVGYGWNVNVGTLNRMVRGLPDDMNGDLIKNYQNIRDREVTSTTLGIDANLGVQAGVGGIGLNAGVQGNMNFTFDRDDYTGPGVGISVGAGVYSGVNVGPFSVSGNAGVTLSAHSNAGGTLSTYAGFNAGVAYNQYISMGFGMSVSRSYNTIGGWEKPNIIGSFNISSVSRELQRNFIGSVSNAIPSITTPYSYTSNGTGYKLKVGAEIGILSKLGIDAGIGITYSKNKSNTKYIASNPYKGYGYMYTENAAPSDVLDFTRDNDGSINKDMPYMPPAMKTFDVFSSTAPGATGVFRADRNDFSTVRDPALSFQSANGKNEMHEVEIKVLINLSCIVGVSVRYDNIKNFTEGSVASGGCLADQVWGRSPNGQDQNLFFKPCGATTLADGAYLAQVNGSGQYGFNKGDSVKGSVSSKRAVVKEPVQVLTNGLINDLPPTVVSKSLVSYAKNIFPSNGASKTFLNRSTGNNIENSKIGAVLSTNSEGKTYVYATPVVNNIKNEVAFRARGFDPKKYEKHNGLMRFTTPEDATKFNGVSRDHLYKSTLTPAYATSYLLNAVLSPDYLDVENDGITDDDLGNFVKFNYTRTENDYRWRAPYGDRDSNIALLNEGVRVTKFDDMGSYVIGSKEVWYAHSIESKNYVAEFYLSDREDAKDSRSGIMPVSPAFATAYNGNKYSHAHLQKLDSIRYFSKHDRYYNNNTAIPLKTIYFDYDYRISSNLPNANNSNNNGKLRLVKVRIRHGNEPKAFAETYDLGYTNTNPAYSIGAKDGWGNYHPNNQDLPLCEAPYINQFSGEDEDAIASAFHLNKIELPSGGSIEVKYEADDYCYVQDKRAMALTKVEGIGSSSSLIKSDLNGLYNPSNLNAYNYIYVKRPVGFTGNYKDFLLNSSDLLYFSFNINIAGSAFSDYDQVKGYAQVEDIGPCTGGAAGFEDHLYIKVRTVNLTKTKAKPSPMTNTAINMARAFATDQLYFQEQEQSSGMNRNQGARLKKAALQLGESLFGKNSIVELMSRYKAGHSFNRNKSFVRLALNKPKVGGGSRVSMLTFSDGWAGMLNDAEKDNFAGYRYYYKNEDGSSSGVASYEPTVGGEENPMRSGASYALSNNTSTYPPYDPVEMLKEDPAGESFFPVGSVGYSRIVTESIHKDYARSAQTRLVQEFYTTRDFPYFSSYGPKSVTEVQDKDYPNPGVRDVMLSFLGVSNTLSSSQNSYDIKQTFVVETNDMHGKPKGTYNYRLLPKNNKTELISSTQYFYHSNGGTHLSNEVEVLQHKALPRFMKTVACTNFEESLPKDNIRPVKKTLGVDVDVCMDSREIVSVETRTMKKRGGGVRICILPPVTPLFSWVDNTHKHTDYFKSTVTTKVINRYGILKSVKNYDEGTETIVENKYYDGVTGNAVVQVVKDKWGDNLYTTTIPAYWTKTDLEPSYAEYPYYGIGNAKLLPDTLTFAPASQNSGGYFNNSGLMQASFIVANKDFFHKGDELFVKGKITGSSSPNWHRLYVSDVLVKKANYNPPDPLEWRWGNASSANASYQIYVMPYKVRGGSGTGLGWGKNLGNIEALYKYRSGRKNMLELTAGRVSAFADPFTPNGSASNNDNCFNEMKILDFPSFLKPVIEASANAYQDIQAILHGSLDSMVYNPISTGVLNQPYINSTYMMIGERKPMHTVSLQSNTIQLQRGNGILPNWYYWLPAHIDSTSSYASQKPLLTHFDNNNFNTMAQKVSPTSPAWYSFSKATWKKLSEVKKSLPNLGPVEETNPLGIYSAVYLEPITKQVAHVTANGKFGQTWVENFEDMKRVLKRNHITDLLLSPFQRYMTEFLPTNIPGYSIFDTMQVNPHSSFLTGNFKIDNDQSHTGTHSLKATTAVNIKVIPKYTNNPSGYSREFDFNLDAVTRQRYTCEVWVKSNTSNAPITAPEIITANTTPPNYLKKVSGPIDGWSLYRTNINVSNDTAVNFSFPAGQSYDDLRVFPAGANVKSYVYHPFKNYLMATLDENNNATFYEYDSRNQLVRLKKETEKGIITVTENIKNIVGKP